MKTSTQLVVRVEPKLRKRLNIAVARLDTTIQAAVDAAIRRWLEDIDKGRTKQPVPAE